MAAITIKNLTFAYTGDVPALRDVSMEIESGEFVLLCGPTGSGKSTLLRCINGLIPHFHRGEEYSGTVIVGGKPVEAHSIADLSRSVGFVFQNPENQLVALNVERELAFGPENLGLDRDEIRERVDRAIERVGISHLRNSSPFNLSGGEQQRVAIASVLAMEPDILLLDEPTSNLDPVMAQNIISLLLDLNRTEKRTVIITEHRLDLILPFVDRVVALEGGRVLSNGTPQEFVVDEKVHASDINLPEIVKIFLGLEREGFLVNVHPLTVDSAAEILEDYFRGLNR
ncbi:MAG: energy-coupling factor ABC transporter ATP-binding protein [Promethearchaeota archaeon]